MYKEIRVPENIEDHDLQTKVYNIYRLVDRG